MDSLYIGAGLFLALLGLAIVFHGPKFINITIHKHYHNKEEKGDN